MNNDEILCVIYNNNKEIFMLNCEHAGLYCDNKLVFTFDELYKFTPDNVYITQEEQVIHDQQFKDWLKGQTEYISLPVIIQIHKFKDTRINPNFSYSHDKLNYIFRRKEFYNCDDNIEVPDIHCILYFHA